ncbi:alpha/beta hydrolase [Pajaroellobacter abortibovis]|uniref:Esterase n=1 Tax=Pajaroellobacter abortibovis TaxID=1882918 RepID=A0A1L6MYX2_9BACT|nr:alpha/beta hydrolase-fold protein [Pajaroellobacter abortibovis]APS00679.1 hypothetical protein BCY86_08320 [Pajaroellobacter abortibovis]
MDLVERRSFLVGVLLGVMGGRNKGTGKVPSGDAATPPAPLQKKGTRGGTRLLEWTLSLNKMKGAAAVILPDRIPPGVRLPVLIALHGQAEALKGMKRGIRGWPDDYALRRAICRIANPPLTCSDFEGWVDKPYLDMLNANLHKKPFGGLIVACPYVPNFDLTQWVDVDNYARLLLDVLLPRIYRETPTIPSPASTGIDGVSLGGAVALRIGLKHPRHFGAVGALQPAVSSQEIQQWVKLASGARRQSPSLLLRIVTSQKDFFREPVNSLSQAWTANHIAHTFYQFPGPHDYSFNRGPGAIELLTWHDQALRPPEVKDRG